MPPVVHRHISVKPLLLVSFLVLLICLADGHDSFTASLQPTASAAGPSATDACSSNGFVGTFAVKLLEYPQAVVAADFNRDGKPDVVVPTDGAGKILVMLGTDAGKLSAPTILTNPGYPVSVDVGDFNGDTKIDIVAANYGLGNLAFFFGDGAGGFSSAINITSANSNPTFVLVADFNRDQKADLAVSHQNGTIAIMLGDGSGSFSTTTFTADERPLYLVSRDFNLDGNLDLAEVTQFGSAVSTFSGNGLGGFGPAASFTAGESPNGLAPADFNNDGKVDLAVSLYANKIVVLLNNGDGTFGAPTIYSVPGQSPVVGVAVGDFDNDGNLDFAGASVNVVSIWFGDGGGSFARQTNYTMGLGETSLAVDDFNADGSSDLVVVGYSDASLSLLINDGTGNFITAPRQTVGTDPNSILKADFNNDGKLDLATANRTSNDLSILLGDGAGAFAAARNFSVGAPPPSSSSNFPASLAAGDFNGDNKTDLVTANQTGGNVSVLLGDGAGNFPSAQKINVGNFPFYVAVGEFNSDGKQDLVVTRSSAANISVLFGDGNGNFGAPVVFSGLPGPKPIAVGDVNGDGKNDIVAGNTVGAHELSILLGDGAGGFGPATNYPIESFANPSAVAIADFNGDTKPDVIVAELGMDRVALLTGNGAGAFSAPLLVTVGDAPSGLTVADFNGDGFRDVAVANSTSCNISLLLGNGSGGLASGGAYFSRIPTSVVAGDFNSDGRIDFATDAVDVFNSTCLDPSITPLPILSVNDPSASEESSGVTFTVTLSAAASQPVTVQYYTSGESAVNTVDFQPTTSSLTFLPGETTKNILVPIVNDSINEFNEHFNLNLYHPTNASILKRQGVASITDSDPEPTLSVNNLNVLEGNSGTAAAEFTVALSSQSGKLVSLNYATADGTATSGQDYAATSGVLNIGAGNATKKIAVTVNGDTTDEANETLFLNLTSPLHASIADSQGIATIVDDDSQIVVSNTNDSGAGSLRQAILDANTNTGTDTVVFDIPGSGARTISVLSALPDITDPIIIDATTQSGFAGTPIVEVNGAAAASNGLVVKAGGSTIKGLVINRFSGFGIWLFFCDNNTIQGNYIGVDPTGTLGRSNSNGIFFSASSNNLIGGTTTAARNLISGNSFAGIETNGANNLVQGNFIGTNAAGTGAIPNGANGLQISNGGPSSANNVIGGTAPGAGNLISGNPTGIRVNAPATSIQGNLIGTDVTGKVKLANGGGINAVTTDTLIGGTTPEARNIISGNNGDGVFFGGSGSRLQGNFIGLDITGTIRLGNGGSGVVAGNSALIGGTTPGARNVISGNGGFGNISLGSNNSGGSATVQNNLIGTDVTGDVALTNPLAGISISSSSNVIGGSTPLAANIISGNRSGIEVGGSIAPGPTGNIIQGNIIGLNEDRTVVLPNLLGGIRISDSSNNTIGGGTFDSANFIRSNHGPGIVVFSGTRNALHWNSIDANDGLGIDLGGDGVTANDSGDLDTGANNLQNFPLLTQSTSNSGGTTVQGTLNSTPNSTFQIEFYYSASCDASGTGEGSQFLGTTNVTTDGSGNTSFVALSPVPLSSGRAVTATATDSQGNTSEFSPCQTNQTSLVSFSQSAYIVGESGGAVTITINRTNSQSGPMTVDYATVDNTANGSTCATINGVASGRCDYTTALGTLRFAVGESTKSFVVLISQDNYVEGPESLGLTLSKLTGAAFFGSPATATLTITDDPSEPPANPINDAEAFVRQHYHDFLNREPDAAGLAFWSGQITECQQPGATCSEETRRINVSAAFFLSIEFQETGYLVERIYKAAYGEATGTSNFGPPHHLPVPVVRFGEFLPDTQQIGQGVVVGVGDWQTQLENNKVAFTQQFVTRARFFAANPRATPAEYVDGLFAHAGVTPSAAERTSIIDEFGGAATSGDLLARARALRRVAENTTLKQQETNRAFVLMQYFGYLRRNPDDLPDADYTGYDFWLTKLNEFNGNFVNAEMVKAFIVSGEYRQRFGP